MNDHLTISTFQLFQMFPDAESARVYLESRLYQMDKQTEPNMTKFYDDPKFQQAALEATRSANRSNKRMRIIRRSKNEYLVLPSAAMFIGVHVSFVAPDRALVRTIRLMESL